MISIGNLVRLSAVNSFLGMNLLMVLTVASSASAAESSGRTERLSWPDKSGPTFDGHAAAADIVGLPTEWDEETGKNIAWKVPLENEGLSTPIIGLGRIFLTSATKDGKQMFILALDPATGKVVNQKLLFENPEPEPLFNAVNTYASCSCVLEPDALYVHFGSYGTARLDPVTFDIVWQRRDLDCRHFRGPGSSPIIFQNLIVLTFDGIDKQYSAALDKQTGKTVWLTPRSTDFKDLTPEGKPKADGDLRKAYCTPSFVNVNGRWQLISIGSKAGFGYDALTGQEIWTFEHTNMNASARPLFFSGMTIVNSGGDAHTYGIKLDDTTQGNITQSHIVWDRKKGNSKLSSPVLVDGRLFMVSDNGIAYCADPNTGADVWTHRLGGAFVAAPVVAGNLIYFCNEKGESFVIRAGAEYEEVAKNLLAEGMRSSPAIANGAIYLRTFGFLYKIAAGK